MRIDHLRLCIAGFYMILSGVVTAQPPRYEPSPMEVAHAQCGGKQTGEIIDNERFI
jgi:hypothetical protein